MEAIAKTMDHPHHPFKAVFAMMMISMVSQSRQVTLLTHSSEYVVAADESSLARYLESNLSVIHPAAADDDDDPWRAHDPTQPARRADLAQITHSGAYPSTILIDVTIATHNSRAAGRASLPGCAAEARYAAKAASYALSLIHI